MTRFDERKTGDEFHDRVAIADTGYNVQTAASKRSQPIEIRLVKTILISRRKKDAI